MSSSKKHIFKIAKDRIISCLSLDGLLTCIDVVDGETLLFQAIKVGNLDAVKYLLRAHKNALYVQIDGIFPFYYACSLGVLNIVKHMYIYDKCQASSVSTGTYPMYVSCYNGHVDIVKFLCENGHVDQLYIQSEGIYPFYASCYTNSLDVVKYLLSNLPSKGSKDSRGLLYQKSTSGSVFKAVCTNIDESIEIVEFLIEFDNEVIDSTVVVNNMNILTLLCETYKFVPDESTLIDYDLETLDYLLDRTDFMTERGHRIFKYLVTNYLELDMTVTLKLVVGKITEKEFKQTYRQLYDKFINKFPVHYKGGKHPTPLTPLTPSPSIHCELVKMTKDTLLHKHVNANIDNNNGDICNMIEMLVSMHDKGIIHGNIISMNPRQQVFNSAYYSDQYDDMFNDYKMLGLLVINVSCGINATKVQVSDNSIKTNDNDYVVTRQSIDSSIGVNAFNILRMLLTKELSHFLKELNQIGDIEYSAYVTSVLIQPPSPSINDICEIIHESYINDKIQAQHRWQLDIIPVFDMESRYDVIFNAVLNCRKNKLADYNTLYKYYDYVINNTSSSTDTDEVEDVIFMWSHVKFLLSKLDLDLDLDLSIIAKGIFNKLIELDLSTEYNSWNFVASITLYHLSHMTQYGLKYLVDTLCIQTDIHINKSEMIRILGHFQN